MQSITKSVTELWHQSGCLERPMFLTTYSTPITILFYNHKVVCMFGCCSLFLWLSVTHSSHCVFWNNQDTRAFIADPSSDSIFGRLWVHSFSSASSKEPKSWHFLLGNHGVLKLRYVIFYNLLLVFCNFFKC